MKANCGSLFSKIKMGNKAFARSITEYQFPLACWIFYIVETISGITDVMGGPTLFKSQQSIISLHEASAFSQATEAYYIEDFLVPVFELLTCHWFLFVLSDTLYCFKLTICAGSNRSSRSHLAGSIKTGLRADLHAFCFTILGRGGVP